MKISLTLLLVLLSLVAHGQSKNYLPRIAITNSLASGGGAGAGGVGIAAAAVTNATSGTTMTFPMAHSGDNRLLMVGVGGYDGSRVITSVTHNSLPCDLLYLTNFYDATGSAAIYYRIGPDVSGNVVVTYDDGLPQWNGAGAVILTNVNQSSPFGTFVSKYDASAAAVPGVTNTITVASGGLALDFLVAHPHNATFTPNCAELTNHFDSGNGGIRFSWTNSVGSVDMRWVFSGADQAQSSIAVPIARVP